MNYIKDTLSEKELNFLLEQLDTTKVLTGEELNPFKKVHPYVLNNQSGLYPSTFTIYDTNNETLNNWIFNKFSKNELVESIYSMEYGKETFSKKHKDYLRKVCIILINDDFDGGRFLIEDADINLNNLGDYVILDGQKYEHEVTKITRGLRKVLVIFFKSKETLL